MKKLLTIIVVATIIGSAATFWFLQNRQEEHHQTLLTKLQLVEKELSSTRKDLLGYTKYTAYLSESKKAIEEQMSFLAAKVERDYVHVEHIQKSTFGIKTEATVILNYTVEYSFGFDLRPDRFSISGDSDGITITLSKPGLVASPAVKLLTHEIPSKGVFIDEQAAVIGLQEKLFNVAQKRAMEIQREETVTALCEKKLGEFLRDFLARQPNVRVVPVIKFVYAEGAGQPK